MAAGVAVVRLDVPFPLTLASPCILVYEREKGVAGLCATLREGSVGFARSRPLEGPTLAEDLKKAIQIKSPEFPTVQHQTRSVLPDGREVTTLHITTGPEGGYQEAKYYCEIDTALIVDDTNAVFTDTAVLKRTVARATDCFNLFADKYLAASLDVRVGHIDAGSNLYLAEVVVADFPPEDIGKTPRELLGDFGRLRFRARVGSGPARVVRLNSWDAVGPVKPMSEEHWRMLLAMATLADELPVVYRLLLSALRELVVARDAAIAVVEAGTAFEVHVARLLVKLLVDGGLSESEAGVRVTDDKKYWGIKNKLRRLDELLAAYAAQHGQALVVFYNTPQRHSWERDAYKIRNAIVHEGRRDVDFYTARNAIGACWDAVCLLEESLPDLREWLLLKPDLARFEPKAGAVVP